MLCPVNFSVIYQSETGRDFSVLGVLSRVPLGRSSLSLSHVWIYYRSERLRPPNWYYEYAYQYTIYINCDSGRSSASCRNIQPPFLLLREKPKK